MAPLPCTCSAIGAVASFELPASVARSTLPAKFTLVAPGRRVVRYRPDARHQQGKRDDRKQISQQFPRIHACFPEPSHSIFPATRDAPVDGQARHWRKRLERRAEKNLRSWDSWRPSEAKAARDPRHAPRMTTKLPVRVNGTGPRLFPVLAISGVGADRWA